MVGLIIGGYTVWVVAGLSLPHVMKGYNPEGWWAKFWDEPNGSFVHEGYENRGMYIWCIMLPPLFILFLSVMFVASPFIWFFYGFGEGSAKKAGYRILAEKLQALGGWLRKRNENKRLPGAVAKYLVEDEVVGKEKQKMLESVTLRSG